jgi:ATP-binding cassette subfamily B protein
MGFGLPGGRFTIGPTSMQANADAGLPFADVPGDLAGQVEAVLEHEPNHPDPVIDFSHSRWDRRPFGLRTFLRPHVGGLAIAVVLVIVETSLLHLGPLLVQLGIDRGVLAKDTDVLVTLALVFVGSVVLAALATALRTAFKGQPVYG